MGNITVCVSFLSGIYKMLLPGRNRLVQPCTVEKFLQVIEALSKRVWTRCRDLGGIGQTIARQ